MKKKITVFYNIETKKILSGKIYHKERGKKDEIRRNIYNSFHKELIVSI